MNTPEPAAPYRTLPAAHLADPKGGVLNNWGIFVGIILSISGIEAISNMTGLMKRPERDSRNAILAVLLKVVLATIFLGLVFAVGVGIEWSEAEFSVHEPYGTAFFSMTGLHASHVISGVGILALVAYLGARGHFTKDSHWGVEAAIKYWHFVDVVWVFFYPALYLINW